MTGEEGDVHGIENEVVEADGARGVNNNALHSLGDSLVVSNTTGVTEELGNARSLPKGAVTRDPSRALRALGVGSNNIGWLSNC
ncbi:unnamed protein product [Ilex paraguariensis]|uniref:Uncharacterized protein n=1 Tax=Ilex paraguariensis TaxID=185542 RepID=A0ABC8TC84_9AQUA